jgi:CheY-like chemotaxis protein
VVSKVTLSSDALCILVVEDDPMVRLFIVGYLRDQGYFVVEADTGEKAVSLLRVEQEPPISVVFTDIQLGGELTGWDVAEAFRRAYPDIRVIYASGRYHDGERRVPDSVFFTKPYIPNDIVEAIAEAA